MSGERSGETAPAPKVDTKKLTLYAQHALAELEQSAKELARVLDLCAYSFDSYTSRMSYDAALESCPTAHSAEVGALSVQWRAVGGGVHCTVRVRGHERRSAIHCGSDIVAATRGALQTAMKDHVEAAEDCERVMHAIGEGMCQHCLRQGGDPPEDQPARAIQRRSSALRDEFTDEVLRTIQRAETAPEIVRNVRALVMESVLDRADAWECVRVALCGELAFKVEDPQEVDPTFVYERWRGAQDIVTLATAYADLLEPMVIDHGLA